MKSILGFQTVTESVIFYVWVPFERKENSCKMILTMKTEELWDAVNNPAT